MSAAPIVLSLSALRARLSRTLFPFDFFFFPLLFDGFCSDVYRAGPPRFVIITPAAVSFASACNDDNLRTNDGLVCSAPIYVFEVRLCTGFRILLTYACSGVSELIRMKYHPSSGMFNLKGARRARVLSPYAESLFVSTIVKTHLVNFVFWNNLLPSRARVRVNVHSYNNIKYTTRVLRFC